LRTISRHLAQFRHKLAKADRFTPLHECPVCLGQVPGLFFRGKCCPIKATRNETERETVAGLKLAGVWVDEPTYRRERELAERCLSLLTRHGDSIPGAWPARMGLIAEEVLSGRYEQEGDHKLKRQREIEQMVKRLQEQRAKGAR
jgi:hypothetical protein